jgi:hypothetical protein
MNKKNIFIILASIFILFLILFLIRIFSEVQMDDVNPQRFCEPSLIGKSKILMIIPLLNNISIAENQTWCEEILALNKTLGMHGVFHTSAEFNILRNTSYIEEGIVEFQKCFGYFPIIFEAPELKLSSVNKMTLESLNFSIRPIRYNIFHKVYHCTDYEKTSYLVRLNKIIRLF